MPPTNEPIAQLVLPAISATGAADVVRIVVMAPVQIDAEEWRCPVEVSGLGRFFGGGVAAGDSLQALSLALRLVSSMLRSMLADGHRLLMPVAAGETDGAPEDFPIDAYFSPHPSFTLGA